MRLDEVSRKLSAWADQEHGAGARVERVRAMPGNAGLSFGFLLRREDADPLELVVRMAPPGVTRSGNTDVLRQVPLLRELGRQGRVPVAPVHWAMEDSPIFGTSAFIVEMLSGRPLHMTSGELSYAAGPGGVEPLLEQAVDALADIHATSLSGGLVAWATPRALDEDLDWAILVLGRGAEGDFTAAGENLATVLRERAPGEVAVGLLHGDYQTNNILFDQGRLVGIVDWELAAVGAQLIDLGWLVMMSDRLCWEPEYAATLRVTADSATLVGRYERAAGREVRDAEWYTGLACLRFGAIIAYNLRLHLEGKRRDPYYEVLARSLPNLFSRGMELVTASD